jgi:5-carboxymethyl-2-hydroxymuconate isomerase
MPHIHLETTADLPENGNIPDILEALVRRLAAFETVKPAAVKAYHTLRSNWAIGEGGPPGFAHCTVMIVTGRTPALKGEIADGMYEELCSHFTMSLENAEVGVTLELREMEKETYRKMDKY